MKSMRNDSESEFERIEKEATALAQKCDITTDYQQPRVRKRKRFHEEIAVDDGISEARKKFIVDTYIVSLDFVINRTTKRFKDFKNVASKFSCLDPKKYGNADNFTRLESLADIYSDVIESRNEIVLEFLSFQDMYKEITNIINKDKSSSVEVEGMTINNVLKFMIANDMCSTYPNLSTLYRIFLTIPINSAGAERSFSRLKFIKSYVLSTMGENRLSGLALISIERQCACEVDYNEVVDNFARMKPRRKKLL